MISFNMLMDTLFTKTSFFSQFSKETMRFFHNFQKKRHNFSQLVWYRTLSQFWKKNAELYSWNTSQMQSRGLSYGDKQQHILFFQYWIKV